MLLASLWASALLSDSILLLAVLTALTKHLLILQFAGPPPVSCLVKGIILAVEPPFVAVHLLDQHKHRAWRTKVKITTLQSFLLSFFIVESPVCGRSSREASIRMWYGGCLNVSHRLELLVRLVGVQLRPFDRREDLDRSECDIVHAWNKIMGDKDE